MNELIGKGRPFYSALDMGAKALKRKVGTGAEFLKELMALPGVKPTELKERGLEELMSAPKMTHEQFLGQLARKPAPKINEKVLTEGGNDETIQELIDRDAREYANREIGTSPRMRDDWSETYDDFVENANQNKYLEYQKEADKLVRQGLADPAVAHFEYTLPGGENYREMLIKDPQGKFGGVPAHFHGEPNIIASMRLKDRTGPNGEKLLHLEELQSDWHQQGREKGYHTEKIEKRRKELSDLAAPYIQNNKAIPKEIHDELTSLPNDLAPPDAPFKKNWEEMAIKRLIHHAAEKGYHGIVVTPGKEQADRYGLAKHINKLNYDELGDLRAFDHEGRMVLSKNIPVDELHEHIGKELANKIAENHNKRLEAKQVYRTALKSDAPNEVVDPLYKNYIAHPTEYSGLDLEVGGEGMKGFYDKKVPNIFNAVGKKHGVKMELHKHPIETGKEQMIPDNAGLGMIRSGNPEHAQLHHFPITEPMREDVLKNGLPLYKTGGIIHKAEGGNVQPSVEQMRMALQNKSTFPKYGIQSIGANEAPDLSPKYYIQPNKDGNLGVGGVDMDNITPGMQLVKQEIPNMNPPNSPNAPQAPQSPLGAPPSPQGGQSNILNLTPQGQALGAMSPPQPPQGLKEGGDVKPKKLTVDQIKQLMFEKAQEGLSKPSEILGKHEGKYLHLTEADRAKVEKRLNGMRGGVGFSQIGLENPDYMRRVWGVGKPGVVSKLLNRQTRGLSPEDQAIWSTFIGTPEMHTSNQLVFNRMWNKFQEAKKEGKLSPELEAKMLDIMRSAMTKATKKTPAKPIFEPDVSFDNTHHLFDTFERRRVLANLMAGKQIGGKKGQIFDASKMIENTTDPKLLHAPSLSVGPHLFTLTGESSYEPHLNAAFPHMLHGETSSDTFQQIPFEHAAPEFVQQIMKEKGRKPGYMDIVRRMPRQHISEEYLTNLQKMGYKKGGKAKESIDTMRYALTKTKKAK